MKAGLFLAAERLNLGLSLAEAAAKIGVSRGTLERAEAGAPIRVANAKLIADFYGTKVTAIWPVETKEAA